LRKISSCRKVLFQVTFLTKRLCIAFYESYSSTLDPCFPDVTSNEGVVMNFPANKKTIKFNISRSLYEIEGCMYTVQQKRNNVLHLQHYNRTFCYNCECASHVITFIYLHSLMEDLFSRGMTNKYKKKDLTSILFSVFDFQSISKLIYMLCG